MIGLTVDGGIATVSLRRPPVNAFDNAQLDRFAAILRELQVRDDVVVVLIRSDELHFSAGADIKALVDTLEQEGDEGVERTTAFAAAMQGLWGELADLPVPTIAAISGAATGGGLELALACDLRVAGSKARFGLPEVRLGLLPAAGGTQRLTQLVGRGVAVRMLLTGELIDSATAARIGLVEWVVDDSDLETHARRVATAISLQSKPAMVEIKRCVAEAITQGGFDLEIEATRRLHRTPEVNRMLREFAGVGS